MAIESKDLVQADATIIAGILVLLTVSSIASISNAQLNKIILLVISAFATVAILPFAMSGFKIVDGNDLEGKRLFKAGVLYLIGVVFVIIGIRSWALFLS
jgi:hypothetical protein